MKQLSTLQNRIHCCEPYTTQMKTPALVYIVIYHLR